jgi:xanthine dehydrogenase accessory factor
VFIDVIGSSNPLYIFGAGHVVLALAQVLEGTPFTPHLIDDREDWIRSQRIPENAVLHLSAWKPFADEQAIEGMYAVVMTPNHAFDLQIVNHLCQRKWKYLGLIGSASKWGQFKEALRQLGRKEAEISSIQCPAGNKKLGHSPQEIAISIASEILAIHHAL